MTTRDEFINDEILPTLDGYADEIARLRAAR